MYFRPCLIISLITLVKADYYLDQVEGQCYDYNTTYLCAKYRFLKYVDDVNLYDFKLSGDSSVKFVEYPSDNVSDVLIFPESRKLQDGESEFMKIVKFFQRKVEKFLNHQGVSLELPEEARIINEDGKEVVGDARGKKKKSVIFPVIILVKLFKIKILVSLVLAGVMFIKKILLFGAFILPGVVASIKHHCKQQDVQVVPHIYEDDHYGHDYHSHDHDDTTGYGHSGYGSDKHHHWDRIYKRKHAYLS